MTNASYNEHLRLIKIFHYVFGGLACLGGLLPLLYIILGQFIMHSADNNLNSSMHDKQAAHIVGVALTIIPIIVTIFIEAMAIMILLSGNWISARKNYWFSFILACLMCLSIPFGTALGVFTIITLNRPEVKAQYGLT